MLRHAGLLTALSLSSLLSAQSVVVDYDDGTVVSPPEFSFPFYTPGVGSLGRTVRVQFQCPADFAGLPTSTMLCTRVGFQLSGQCTYGTFEVRAGVSTVSMLSTVWAQNLPDQRLQFDLGGDPLDYGTANQWVELDLAHPFVFTPGESVVVDLITNIQTVGSLLGTARTTNPTPRVVDSDYQGLPVAPSVRVDGGLKFRMVMEPLGALTSFGEGCPGLGGAVPAIGANGLASIGNAGFEIELSNSRPSAISSLLLGTARGVGASIPLPLSLGNDCGLLIEPDLLSQTTLSTGTTVAGTGTATVSVPVPNVASLRGVVLFAQWAQVDDAAGNALGFTFSDGGVLSLD